MLYKRIGRESLRAVALKLTGLEYYAEGIANLNNIHHGYGIPPNDYGWKIGQVITIPDAWLKQNLPGMPGAAMPIPASSSGAYNAVPIPASSPGFFRNADGSINKIHVAAIIGALGILALTVK